MKSLKDLVYAPRPRLIREESGHLTFKEGFGLFCRGRPAALHDMADQFHDDVREILHMESILLSGPIGHDDLCQAVFRLLNPGETKPQGYRLKITREGAYVEASDPAGVFYGTMTLRQIIRQCGATIPCGYIEDHPDFATRGVMLDISRDKVPTMETLVHLVDLLAELKINHLQLYTEHTFAYKNHSEVWANASPVTAEEIQTLEEYCHARFIELVPNQNSFGHLHRWLKHPRYRELAECPEGFTTPWGEKRSGPFSINPLNPKSLELLDELYAELLPRFSSEKFNVGCDETFDLGQGKSKDRCDEIGKGRVYLDFLKKIYELVKKHDRTMMFWGDIVLHHPELILDLPPDLIALVWGYEANHPFDEQCEKFSAARIPFYVCPGTSTWNSIAGRTDNAIANLRHAAEQGIKHGAQGYLITDWGDNGHWQPLPASYLSFLYGASVSWAFDINESMNVVEALNVHAFHDANSVFGRLAYDLGNAYQHAGPPVFNASALFRWLHQEASPQTPDSDTASRVMAFIEKTMEPVGSAQPTTPENLLIRDEFILAARMLRHAVRRTQNDDRKILADDIEQIITEFRRIWLLRNRPGGLEDSLRPLEERRADYMSNTKGEHP